MPRSAGEINVTTSQWLARYVISIYKLFCPAHRVSQKCEAFGQSSNQGASESDSHNTVIVMQCEMLSKWLNLNAARRPPRPGRMLGGKHDGAFAFAKYRGAASAG